jgi:class 3 adenylate cyclase
MTERLDRRLVAVMFTDMVGYTALMQADERAAVDKRDRYMSASRVTMTPSVGRSSSGSVTAA